MGGLEERLAEVQKREVKLNLNDALIYIRLHRSRNLATRNLKVRPANAWDDSQCTTLHYAAPITHALSLSVLRVLFTAFPFPGCRMV
jgi:hypothetical protein